MTDAADIIAAHQPQDLPSTQCRCGLDLDPDDNSQSQSWDGLHAQHVLAALKAAGYEVVKLPAALPVGPTAPPPSSFHIATWAEFEDIDGEPAADVAAIQDGSVELGMSRYEPEVARSLAAALLAAANVAEEAK